MREVIRLAINLKRSLPEFCDEMGSGPAPEHLPEEGDRRMVVLLAGGSGFPHREGLRQIKIRQENIPGASRIPYDASSIVPGR